MYFFLNFIKTPTSLYCLYVNIFNDSLKLDLIQKINYDIFVNFQCAINLTFSIDRRKNNYHCFIPILIE